MLSGNNESAEQSAHFKRNQYAQQNRCLRPDRVLWLQANQQVIV